MADLPRVGPPLRPGDVVAERRKHAAPLALILRALARSRAAGGLLFAEEWRAYEAALASGWSEPSPS